MSTVATAHHSEGCTDFVEDAYLADLLDQPRPEPARVCDIIAKARDKQPLPVGEAAELLRADDPDDVEQILEAARELKRDVYGNRIVLFAPLYIGNECVNDCLYCGFRRSNTDAVRTTLSAEQLRGEVEALLSKGHKRLILVFGEHPRYDADSIADTVRSVYSVRGNGTQPSPRIRRVNINAAPLDVEGFRTVKAAGIGTYQVFQETYHHATYARYHPAHTLKSDYPYRLGALDRAMEAGIDDVGLGALFGLHDWRFEVLGLVTHALHLQERYGVGPHTISFPRLQPASGVQLDSRYQVDDGDFKRLVATLRLAVPYTGLICTARESAELRREVMAFGVSQIDAGSRIELGGYSVDGDGQCVDREQFMLSDVRSLDAIMRELVSDGYIPSFCTACYRRGRTGEHFMELAIPGFIKRLCTPNALTTLAEYLVDYALPGTRQAGASLITEELAKLGDDEEKQELERRLHRIMTSDDRDLCV